MTKIFEPHWESFAEMVIPDTAPYVQIREMEMAFYSGAVVGMALMMAASEGKTEDEAMEYITALHKECNSHVEKFMAKTN